MIFDVRLQAKLKEHSKNGVEYFCAVCGRERDDLSAACQFEERLGNYSPVSKPEKKNVTALKNEAQ